jgi:hypothetical protein
MRTVALLACASLSAGCSTGGRYLVDAQLMRLLDAPPPLATRLPDGRRAVGHATVEIDCTGQGEDPPLYRGAVEGAGGRWQFDTRGPVRPGGACTSEAIDEMAEQMALRYRKARGAVPAVREEDGTSVYLDETKLQMDTRQLRGDQISVEARGTNSARLTAAILAGISVPYLVAGGVLLALSQSPCSGADAFGCSVSSGFDKTTGETAIVIGATLAVMASISLWASLSKHPQEVAPDRSDKIYFGIPSRKPTPPPAPPADDSLPDEGDPRD